MTRSPVRFVGLSLVGLAVASSAGLAPAAVAPSPPPAARTPAAKKPSLPKAFFPAGMDLSAVPVGTWCEYVTKTSQGAPSSPGLTRRERIAVTAREPSDLTVEVSSTDEGGKKAAPYVMMLKIAIAANAPAKVKQRFLRTGDGFPKEIRSTEDVLAFLPAAREFLIRTETVHLRQGPVSARLYKRAWGDGSLEVWVNEQITPCGVVRSRETNTQRTMVRELAATGRGAASQILTR